MSVVAWVLAIPFIGVAVGVSLVFITDRIRKSISKMFRY